VINPGPVPIYQPGAHPMPVHELTWATLPGGHLYSGLFPGWRLAWILLWLVIWCVVWVLWGLPVWLRVVLHVWLVAGWISVSGVILHILCLISRF